jgi:hypothetical protein
VHYTAVAVVRWQQHSYVIAATTAAAAPAGATAAVTASCTAGLPSADDHVDATVKSDITQLLARQLQQHA